ncbi:phage major capsid protein [Enterococcus avium]|uniref:phage major capsid protein n=1 Tax=Enterococcus avium TaxID=33945 RepID=UPI0028901C8E|nr:P22 coat protein - protein 5 domain protein [Enterococcus avium]MDT2485048.1 P22 coat protein - protein 5 domain protein [Enterococcus avium]MDT2511634.1 P22 coat protein - protein 5 domain protein [Enterococcus avium]
MTLAASNYKNFIPTLWSARLLANLDKSLVALQFVNRDYEGEITAYGDTVKINQIGNVTIKDYTGADIDDPEELDSTQQNLVIDQAKYFNFAVKDVDKAQSNVNLVDAAMGRAAYNLADVIDQDIFGQYKDAGIKVGDKDDSTKPMIVDSPEKAYDALVDLGVKLDEKNVPKVGRKIALPAWYFGLLAKDARFTKDLSILANGVVEGATVGRFELLQSNNLAKEEGKEVYHALGGTTQAISFANQIVETEAYRPEKNFSDAVKGLSVWGRKVIQADCLVDFVISPKA